MTHLTFALITDYLRQQLSPLAMQQTETHLASCQLCRQEVERVQQFLHKLQSEELPEPPASVTANLIAALRRRRDQPLRSHQINGADFDSWATLRPSAVRGTTHERHLLFTTTEGDIDLQVAYVAEEQLYTLRGHILPAQSIAIVLNGTIVRLFKKDILQRQGVTDEFGHFRFSSLATGRYQLQIDWMEKRFLIDNVELAL